MADAFFKPVSGDQRADAEFSGAAKLAGHAGRLLAHRSSCPAWTRTSTLAEKGSDRPLGDPSIQFAG
jgi:hypothetical protein